MRRAPSPFGTLTDPRADKNDGARGRGTFDPWGNHDRKETTMIITTTPYVEGHPVVAYYGIVFGEVISGVNVFKDFAAGIRNFVGGRSASYEDELTKARNEALAELQQRAAQLGANAVVGVDVDYETLGTDNGMIMVTASGTAVSVQ